jgi:hypothetical protein
MAHPPILVSLTTIAPRLPALDFVLTSLLDQSLPPERVVLAISHEPYLLDPGIGEADLSPFVRSLAASGRLEILDVPNTGSYRKLMPLLARGFDTPQWIATADDDVLYPRRWLEGLAETAMSSLKPAVAAYRCRAITAGPDGAILPYADWPLVNCGPKPEAAAGRHLFPTGRGGVLYRSDFFPGDIDLEALRRLAPAQDDLAFRMATLAAGIDVRSAHWTRSGAGHWEFSSAMGPVRGLFEAVNAGNGGGNDEALARLAAALRPRFDIRDVAAAARSAAQPLFNFL